MTNNTDSTNDDPMLEDHSPRGLEREVLGKWTVFLRNMGGILSVIVVCFTAIFNSYTIYISVADNGKWPSETSMFIMMVGPILCAWAFMNVNKTISTIMQSRGAMASRLRNKLASAISTDQPQQRSTDNQ